MRLYSYYTTFILLLLTIAILCFISIYSSNMSEAQNNVTYAVEGYIDCDARQILQVFINHSFPIEDVCSCNISNDVSFDDTIRDECTSKVKFTDSRCVDNDSLGNIEVYVSPEAALQRKESLETSSKDNYYIFRNNNIILTISKKMSNPYIKEYKVLFNILSAFSLNAVIDDADQETSSVSIPNEDGISFTFPVLDFSTPSYDKNDTDISKLTYMIGKDLDAGEYMLLSEVNYSYFIVYQGSSLTTSSILCSETFNTSSIITVSDGQCLLLKNCIAVPIDQAPVFTSSSDGMYKAGTTLEAGTYTMTSLPEKQGYYEITYDSLHTISSIISNDIFTGSVQITVQSGQYLTIKNAHIKKTT